MASKRQYDLILLGATGYTGKLTAEHITSTSSTNLKWAIAGRSQSKLKSLVEELKSLNSNRTAPDVITTQLSTPELTDLAKKTRVVLNCIGPYHLYSTPVVEACANTGTNYLDVTGETPWLKEVIGKYEATAKKNGAILIPSAGAESAPSDLVAYSAVSLVRRVWDCGVMDIVASVHELKSSGASGGTLASGIGLMDHYPLKFLNQCLNDPFIITPNHLVPNTKANIYPVNPLPNTYDRSTKEKLTGVWHYPRLGTLTTSITAKPNQAIVQRSAGLNPLWYGFNFTYEEFMAVSSPFIGFLIHATIALVTFLLAIPPIRALIKLMLPYQPGSGPTKDQGANDAFEIRAIAVAEQLQRNVRKASVNFRFEGGSLYGLTAILLAEAGLTLLENEDEVRKKYGSGFLTPSCLGDAYIEKIDKHGAKITTKQLGDAGSK